MGTGIRYLWPGGRAVGTGVQRAGSWPGWIRSGGSWTDGAPVDQPVDQGGTSVTVP